MCQTLIREGVDNSIGKTKINYAFLTSGKNLEISEDIVVKHPSIEDIWELGNGIFCEDVYWNIVFTLICDPYEYMVMLDDDGIDYETQSPFDVFVILWEKSEIAYIENKEFYDALNYRPIDQIKFALNFFLGDHNFELDYIHEIDDYVLLDVDLTDDKNKYGSYIITREIFEYIVEFIVLIHNLDAIRSDRIKPKNESFKKILIEDKRDELKIKQRNKKKDEENDYIGKSISAVCWGGNGSVSIFDVGKLKIFQLLNGRTIKEKKDHASHLMNGLYFGTVDLKKLNKRELEWSR